MNDKGKLEIFINPSSGVPIYIQIADAIKYAIVTGILKDGEQLPAVRDMAYQITTNPNTVAKAYQKLIKDGFAEVRRGIGTFVLKRKESSQDVEKLKHIVCTLVKEAKKLGVSEDDIVKMIKEEMKGGVRNRNKKA